jgi:hypothetical protein
MRVLFSKSDDFGIRSSSISVTASNLQAILYTVVETRLLTPFQYVASSSCSIFHINMELLHTRRSYDSCNMATLHAPVVILQSHLQALYNIIILTFVIAISFFPGLIRGRRCNSTTARTGGGQRCRKHQS